VYKVGSGDVFSAGFASAWLLEKRKPIDAAWFASRLVAEYVETSQDQFSKKVIEQVRAQAREAQKHQREASRPRKPTKRIYLASPFFNVSEQWLVDEARSAFQSLGFKVFSPIHDVGVGEPREVAQANLDGLRNCGLLFAVLDGVDAGTIFEVGYARALRIPVVAVAESVDANPLTMILGSDCYVTNDFTTGVHAACWKLMGYA
jgi:nucleoside 2-deoxyribosyltransferase